MKNLPKTIQLALLLIFATMAAELLYYYFDKAGNPFSETVYMVSLKSLLISLATYLFLAFNISKRQSWARIVLLAFYSINIYLNSIDIDLEFTWFVNLAIVSVIKILLQLSTAVVLFTGASNRWFSLKKPAEASGTSV